MEEGLLDESVRNQKHGVAIIEHILLDHEEVKAMICELQRAETDDDESMDEFFEDMMQTVSGHFGAGERDLLPLLTGSGG